MSKPRRISDIIRETGRFPRIAGGEDLESVLDSISEDLKSLLDKEERGEEIDESEKQKLESKKAEVEAQIASDKNEVVASAVKAALTAIGFEAPPAEPEPETKDPSVNEIVAATVKAVMESSPGTSRWAGQHASKGFLDTLAEGGSYQVVQPGAQVSVGESRNLKGFIERKSYAELMQVMVMQHKGMANPEQREIAGYLMTKAMAEGTASAGGVLVPEEWMPDILQILSARTMLRRANPRIQPFNKLMNQLNVSSGGTAYWFGENSAVTISEMTFGEAVLLTPKNLGALVPVSNFLLADAPQAESTVRGDMARVIGLAEDLSYFRGTGGTQPLGFNNMVGITEDPIYDSSSGNGIDLTFPMTRQIKAAFRSQNTGPIRPVWFFNPEVISLLEAMVDLDGRWLADTTYLRINEDQMSGVLDGTPFFCSTQLPRNITVGTANNCTDLYLINMEEAILGVNMEMELAVSTEATYLDGVTWNSAFQQNQTLFRAVMRVDLNHRRKAQVIVQHGVKVP